MIGRPPRDAAERFWEKVDQSAGPDGCWPWTSTRHRQGYGKFWFDGKQERAHRVAYLFSKGAIPDGLDILHSCDNPPCQNPAHLGPGTQQDNSNDAVMRGRTPCGARNGSHLHPESVARGDRHGSRLHPERLARGEHHGRAVLTSKQVSAIRRRRLNGEPLKVLAVEFHTSVSTVSKIAMNQTRLKE